TTLVPYTTIFRSFCEGSAVPALPTTSNNGIAGTWAPSTISNTASGSYVFTPTTPCASSYTLNVTITNSTVPTFSIPTTFCEGSTVPALPTTSNNGIAGTWTPSVISNTVSGSYVFTPSTTCASSYTLNVTITGATVPTFNIANNFCEGSTVPSLPTTSDNGITGTWSPSVISNAASGSYVFTPSNACATAYTL